METRPANIASHVSKLLEVCLQRRQLLQLEGTQNDKNGEIGKVWGDLRVLGGFEGFGGVLGGVLEGFGGVLEGFGGVLEGFGWVLEGFGGILGGFWRVLEGFGNWRKVRRKDFWEKKNDEIWWKLEEIEWVEGGGVDGG